MVWILEVMKIECVILRGTANAVIRIRRRMRAWSGVSVAVVYRRRTDPSASFRVLCYATKIGICKRRQSVQEAVYGISTKDNVRGAPR